MFVIWCLNFGGLLVKFCLVCFPFVKTIIPISTSYIYFINYFILFVKFTCLYGLNGVIFVYTIREKWKQ